MTLEADQAEAIRPGEELDPAALAGYLRATQPALTGEPVIRQFRSGHSNLTYLIEIGTEQYVLRRPPFGNQVKTAHDMGREFRVLSALAPVFPLAPRPWAYCQDETVIGAPFYLMERRVGAVIRKSLPDGITSDRSTIGRLCQAFATTLAALHGLDHRAIGLETLGRPEGYGARQVKGWTERYQAAETEPVPEMTEVARWLDRALPSERDQSDRVRAAVIHNDFKFDNLLVAPDDPARIVAVLDWEMATVGDPLMDLGSALAYWVEATDPAEHRAVARVPTAAPGMWTRRQLVDGYAAASGRAVDHLPFYYAFGLFKLAVIGQQIYARYARGLTRDHRFAEMHRTVAILARRAASVAEHHSI